MTVSFVRVESGRTAIAHKVVVVITSDTEQRGGDDESGTAGARKQSLISETADSSDYTVD